MRSSVLKLVLVVLLLVPTAASVSSWTIEDLDEPYSLDQIDSNKNTVQIIRILDSQDRPVDPERMESSDTELSLKYNVSRMNMEYMEDGYWYRMFNVMEDDDYHVEYEIIDRSATGGEINETEYLDNGNINVNLVTDVEDRYKADNQVFIRARVTDNAGNKIDNEYADVSAYFTDGNKVYNVVELGQQSDGDYTNLVPTPSEYNKTFALHINATADNVASGYGSESDVITTYPEKLGRYENLVSYGSGCNNESFFTACERGTDIDVDFNATIFPAEEAQLEVFKERDDGVWMQVEDIEMQKQNGLWGASFEFPDIDTSMHTSNVIMRVNASIDNTYFLLNKNITSESFDIRDKSEPTTYPGRSYLLEIAFVKHFSLKPINETRIQDATVDVNYPNGTLLESFDLSEFEYSGSEGLFRTELQIPDDAVEGSYPIEIEAENIYGDVKTLRSGFNVDDARVTFNVVEDAISFEGNKTGIYTEELRIENAVSEERTLEWYLKGDIVNITTVNNGETIQLPEDGTRVPVEFNIGSIDNYEGEIILSDPEASFNRTVDVNIRQPDCIDRSGDLCLLHDEEWVNITSFRVGHETRTVTLLNLGHEQPLVDASGSGGIEPYLDIEPSSFTLLDTQEVELNYSVIDEGDFIGTITFNTDNEALYLNTKLSSSADLKEPSMTAPIAVDIGQVVEGDTVEETIYINNTGELDIENLEATSSTFDVSLSSGSLTPGENKTFTLEFRDIRSSSGSVDISGSTEKGPVSATITAGGNVLSMRDLSSLEADISDLRSRAESTSTQTRLDNLENKVDEIRSMYDEGDVQAGNTEYGNVRAELNDIDNELSSSQGSAGPDPGETEPGTEEEGSLLVPIVIVLFVFILAGFIFYTSYVPEEGDPLYDLMGNKQ